MTPPETFLQQRKRIKAERERAARGTDFLAADGPTVDHDDPAYTRRASAYAHNALDSIVGELATHPQGSRNDALNNAALRCYRWVGAGLLDVEDTTQALRNAAYQCGLETLEIGATLQSAWRGSQRLGPAYPDLKDRPSDTFESIRVDLDTGEVLINADEAATADDNGVPRTSWWPRDLEGLLAGSVEEEPKPEFLARQDGHRLFYAGKVNALIGESESGKTWIGLLCCAQSLQIGQTVLYLDFEDTLAGITARLRALGVTDQQLANLTYISPDETLGLPQKRDLTETLQTIKPDVVLFDGVNAAMTLLGLDLEKNKDATEFSLALLRPLKRTGAAVITIDHVTKSKDNRGNYAIGAQAKRADIDGCGIIVEVAQPFGRGMTGKLRLTVSKDRPGHVRAVSAGAKNAGLAVLTSSEDGSVTVVIEAPDLRSDDERGTFRPTILMERVSRYLEAVPAESVGVSDNRVISGTTGGKDKHQLPLALQRLIEEGYVSLTLSGTGAKQNKLIKPYRQESDPRLLLDPFGPVEEEK